MIIQALLVLGGLVQAVVAVHPASGADRLDRLLRVAPPLGQEDCPPLGPLPGGVHHVVHLPLRFPRLVPHLRPCPIDFSLSFAASAGKFETLVSGSTALDVQRRDVHFGRSVRSDYGGVVWALMGLSPAHKAHWA